MRAALLAILLCGCGNPDSERPVRKQPLEPVNAPAPEPPKPDAAPPVVDMAALLPKQPEVFGPWAAFPIGTPLDDIRGTHADLFNGSYGVSPSSYEVGVDGKRLPDDVVAPRFGIGTAGGLIAAHTFVLDDKGVAALEAAWGPPRTQVDARGATHHLWATDGAHFELTSSGDAKMLIATNIVPFARYLGKQRFVFEPDRPIVGMPGADAVTMVDAWAKANHLPVTSEGDAIQTARAIAKATGTDVTPDRVVVVGSNGSTTPLSAMPTASLDLQLPPTESSFEKLEYNFTRLRLWLDDKGVVHHYVLGLFLLDDADYKATVSLLAKTFGKPKRQGDSLRFPSKPPVCFPAQAVQYASIEVGCK